MALTQSSPPSLDPAEQFVNVPFMTEPVSSRLRPAARRYTSDKLWRTVHDLPVVRSWKAASDAVFMVMSGLIGLAWFVFFVTMITTGVALLILWIGLPILAALVAMTIWSAQMERDRLRIFLGLQITSPYRYFPSAGPAWRRAWALLKNPQLWRDLAYLLLLFPLGMLGLFLVVYPISLVTAPAWFLMFGAGNVQGWQIGSFPEAILAFIVGTILVVPFAFLVNLAAMLNGRMGQKFLATSTEEVLIERVEELTESRSAVMRAMHLERRRIERDLHDGAQQRLVAMAMDLGLAREKIDADPVAAKALIESSHEESKRVLADLRDLVRGIHPAVLTDRGLDAAISAIAGRSPVPVDIDVDLGTRLPEEVEGTAYFVVVEALTNIAKHSGSTQARVHIRRRGNWLNLEIADNGRGGANLGQGSGLRGLQDRILALDGRFSLSSPPGRGTTIRVEIPCG
jgi:signal transduction histidine kinase